jgi:DNA-binding NarL/FixJ family response regulator
MPKLKTYIVEDSQVIRERLIATLEELAPVRVVATGESEASANQWLSNSEHRVDLIIVDIFLKSGSGLGVLRTMQSLPGHRSVVVFSNYATADIRRKCMELGANRVFDKSKEIDDLMDYCHALRNGRSDRATPLTAL